MLEACRAKRTGIDSRGDIRERYANFHFASR